LITAEKFTIDFNAFVDSVGTPINFSNAGVDTAMLDDLVCLASFEFVNVVNGVNKKDFDFATVVRQCVCPDGTTELAVNKVPLL
jgi:hypothetical protein